MASRLAAQFASFPADFKSLSSEYVVDETSKSNLLEANTIARDANGNIILTLTKGTTASDIYIVVYDSNGVKIKSSLANSFTNNNQGGGDIVHFSDGSSFIVWGSEGQGSYQYSIVGNVFDSTYNKRGDEFIIADGVATAAYISKLPNDNVVIFWGDGCKPSNGPTSGCGFFKLKVYNKLENKLSNELIVYYWNQAEIDGVNMNFVAGSGLGSPTVQALRGGGYVLAWQYRSSNLNDGYISAVIYDSNNIRVGSVIRVNQYSNSLKFEPTIASLKDSFVICWKEEVRVANSFNNLCKIYGETGTVINEAFIVATNVASQPFVIDLQDGGFFISWQMGDSIFGAQFDSYGNKIWKEFKISNEHSLSFYPPYGIKHRISAYDSSKILISWTNSDLVTKSVTYKMLYTNTAYYNNALSGVVINLTTKTSDGSARNDVFTKIYNLIGSQYSDTLVGDVNDNILDGGMGNDIIKDVGGGNDIFIGGGGSDSFTMGVSDGTVTIVDFNPEAGDTLNVIAFKKTFEEVLTMATNNGQNCEITLQQKKIVLLKTDKAQITESWFSPDLRIYQPTQPPVYQPTQPPVYQPTQPPTVLSSQTSTTSSTSLSIRITTTSKSEDPFYNTQWFWGTIGAVLTLGALIFGYKWRTRTQNVKTGKTEMRVFPK